MSIAGEIVRKSAQEVEIDHLLAEEFSCDPGFARRFVEAATGHDQPFEVERVTPEPSLSPGGFGDLMVEGSTPGGRIVLLIEDKLTAGPATRQAERYAMHATQLREGGTERVMTFLVAPRSYGGESDKYDARLDLETVIEILQNADPSRLEFRRAIVARAIQKKTATGVQVHDPSIHAFRLDYLACASQYFASKMLPLDFPRVRDKTYGGDSWFHPIRHPEFPAGVELRHRLWTDVAKMQGQVDLIVRANATGMLDRIKIEPPANSTVTRFSRDGLQASIVVPELRPDYSLTLGELLPAFQVMENFCCWILHPDNEVETRS